MRLRPAARLVPLLLLAACATERATPPPPSPVAESTPRGATADGIVPLTLQQELDMAQ